MDNDIDVSEGDVVDVTFTNTTTDRESSFRATVTDTEDDYMNSTAAFGFKCRRVNDNKEMGVWPGGSVCSFGWQQSFLGEDAEVEVVA